MSEISSTRPHGFFEITHPDEKPTRGETRQCCHCGGHWVMQKGSGKIRGFCFRCNGHVCGPACAECVHWEAALEIAEGTRNPTAVSVPVGGTVSATGIWCPGPPPPG